MTVHHLLRAPFPLAFAVGLMATTAIAAPSSVYRSPTDLSASKQVEAVSVEEGEDEGANCAKSRKRLWVEGEGWLVRKVTTCH